MVQGWRDIKFRIDVSGSEVMSQVPSSTSESTSLELLAETVLLGMDSRKYSVPTCKKAFFGGEECSFELQRTGWTLARSADTYPTPTEALAAATAFAATLRSLFLVHQEKYIGNGAEQFALVEGGWRFGDNVLRSASTVDEEEARRLIVETIAVGVVDANYVRVVESAETASLELGAMYINSTIATTPVYPAPEATNKGKGTRQALQNLAANFVADADITPRSRCWICL